MTSAIEKQVEINETYYAYMVNAKREYLDVQIDKAHHNEQRRSYEMKFMLAKEERNTLETK